MLNSYQFSAAKSVTTAKMLQAAVYNDDGSLKAFNKFRDDAEEIQKQVNQNWLRVERDMCARSSIMADSWAEAIQDKDLYPYWMYEGRMDSRERPEHVALEGLIFRIGDPYGDRIVPPGDWNCRCRKKVVDDLYLRDRNRVVQTPAQAKGWLEGKDEKGREFVDSQFRYNPFDQGMMPKNGHYFEEWRSANQGNSYIFAIDTKGNHLEGFAAAQLPNLSNIVKEWREKYYTDRIGDVIFQNNATLTNVVLTIESIAALHRHPRGVDLLPLTVSRPDEIWMSWQDVNKQDVVIRNYITFSKSSAYVVSTRAGVIIDGKLISLGQAEKYRVGCPWIKK